MRQQQGSNVSLAPPPGRCTTAHLTPPQRGGGALALNAFAIGWSTRIYLGLQKKRGKSGLIRFSDAAISRESYPAYQSSGPRHAFVSASTEICTPSSSR